MSSVGSSSVTFSDSLGLSTEGDRLLTDMARNYRASSTRNINDNDRGLGGQPSNPATSSATSLADSLRNRQQGEDYTFKDIVLKACRFLYDFTIASCQYTLCDCFRKRRRSYVDLGNDTTDTTSQHDIEMGVIKTELKFHFMNPFEKWKYPDRRRFPWKLLIQLIILILVTVQLYFLAYQREGLQKFVSSNRQTFISLFIKNPEAPDPTDYYGTSTVSTLHTHDEFWNQLNFTANAYFNIRKDAIGPYGYGWHKKDNKKFDYSYIPPLNLTYHYYDHASFIPELRHYTFSGDLETSYVMINVSESLSEQLNDTIIVTNFNSVTQLFYDFKLSSVYLDSQVPLCAQFTIKIIFDNKIVSGNMPVTMEVKSDIDECNDTTTSSYYYFPAYSNNTETVTIVVGSLIIAFTIISTILFARSLFLSAHFSKKVKKFFMKHFNYKLKMSEYLPLYNLWFVGAIISNILVDVGILLHLITHTYLENFILELNDISSIIFGLGVFFQWTGILRFLSYFDKYNMLLLTLRVAMPSVLRFMICGGIFYIAFLLLGWLVFAPYHPKFSDPSVTSECLYSLINGDDMFNTYVMMEKKSMPAFIFSKIYLYIFISLFIYVVLSVFISLISDTYETLQELWTVRSRGLLQDFANGHVGQGHTQQQDPDYELLTGSTRPLNQESPLIAHGVPILNTSNPNSPALLHSHHHHCNPAIPVRGTNVPAALENSSSMYPSMGPGIIVTDDDAETNT
jgi:hypothetical protein